MSSLGIFDKETKTYKKVADLSKPAVIDSAMSDTSTNPVQNKVVKSYIDNGVNSSKKLQTYKQGSTTETYGDSYPIYAQWRDTGHVKMKCDNYTVETDYATSAGSASSVEWNNISGKPSTYAPSSHTHSSVNDIDNRSDITFSYSKNGLNYDEYIWLAAWNGYELRAVNKNQFATASDYANIRGEIDNLKKSVSDGKTIVANAITAKGVTTATDATFATMANNISQITGKKYAYGSCSGIPNTTVTVRNYPSILASINTEIKGVSPELVVVQLNSLLLCFKEYLGNNDTGLFNSTIAITDKGSNKIINPTPSNSRSAQFTIDPVYNSNTGLITLNTSVYFELGDIDETYLDQYNIKYYANSLNWYLIY